MTTETTTAVRCIWQLAEDGTQLNDGAPMTAGEAASYIQDWASARRTVTVKDVNTIEVSTGNLRGVIWSGIPVTDQAEGFWLAPDAFGEVGVWHWDGQRCDVVLTKRDLDYRPYMAASKREAVINSLWARMTASIPTAQPCHSIGCEDVVFGPGLYCELHADSQDIPTPRVGA